MNPTQNRRPLAIQTALGSDALLLTRFTVRERISAPFEIEAELAAVDPNADFNKVVGHKATIRLELGKKGTRYFSGYVSRLVQTGNQGQFARYRATIVPWLWFLTRTSDCRVFQRLSALDIAEEVFGAQRFGSDFYDLQTSARYPKRRYCVQYRETDFNFVNRLFESEGIYYWFSHTKTGHRLVLADRIGASKPTPGFEKIDYRQTEQSPGAGRETITEWLVEKEVQPVRYDLKDFDFKKPSEPLTGKHEIPREHGMARFPLYDYPGEYFESGDADHYAQVRLEELQARHEIVRGTTTAMGLVAGGVFELKEHPQAAQNRKYLITELNLSADAGEFASGGSADALFNCHFSAIPSTVPFRPARVTPKPLIQGVQTATVVGASGEEIHTDEHGRVKVQFHWDRYGKKDAESSCFIRVSQLWAGKQWGGIHIPRIGQEVLVEFLEGDPDRPVVVGRVYNGELMPPYGLPGNKTQSGIKSRSSLSGGEANFNEIRFEDKKGSEQVYIHAEKNQDNIVENDETTEVGHDRTEHVGHDEKITIDNNRTEKVGVNEDITIGSNRTEKVGANEDITIGSNRTEKVGANESIDVASNRTRTVGANETITVALARTHTVGVNEAITVGAAQEITVGAAQAITVGAAQAITVGANQDTNVGANQSNSVAKDRTTSIGKNDALTVGKKLTISAGDEITITTGKASISMKKDGTIQIKGKDITVDGSGEINIKASKDITMKGKKILQN